MSLIKTVGIVIKHMNLSENDKIITIYTDKLGKVDVVVHGAKSIKNKYMAATQPFCYGEFVLYKGKSLYTLSECSIIESFQTILTNLDKLIYGSYLLELVDNLNEKEIKNVSILALLLKSLYIMTHDEVKLDILKLVFEFKIMAICGYLPQVNHCLMCSREVREGYFSIKSGGIVCINCGKTNKYDFPIDIDLIKYFQFIRNTKLEDINKFIYETKKIEYIKNIMQNYIMYYCDKKFKSLDIIEKIKQ